jgi:ABC-2 type transport system ATP-binding protein
MNNLVEISGLTKVYEGRKLAVNNMNLSIPRGKIIGLLGLMEAEKQHL